MCNAILHHTLPAVDIYLLLLKYVMSQSQRSNHHHSAKSQEIFVPASGLSQEFLLGVAQVVCDTGRLHKYVIRENTANIMVIEIRSSWYQSLLE